MRNDLTDITVVMDRSGSMNSCRSDAEGGLNTFIQKQKEDLGETLFTLIQFDTEYEFVHKGTNIKDVPHCTLEPRGWTALLDAVGRAISETGSRLEKMEEKDRPAFVVFVIITDGYENSSKEFSKEKIKEMVEQQQNTYKWKFIFMGANCDAFKEAKSIGISYDNTLQYGNKKSKEAYDAACSNISRGKVLVSAGFTADVAFSGVQRSASS